MQIKTIVVKRLISLGVWLIATTGVCTTGLAQNVITTTPVYTDGVLYVAGTDLLEPGGHLRAIDLTGLYPVTLWDAAERMPAAGDSGEAAESISVTNLYRVLLTNLSGRLVPLAASHADQLAPAFGVPSVVNATMLIHTLRGRGNVSEENPAGTTESPHKLWGISRSSPVMVARSPAAPSRDRVLYAGAEDGMLHAFYVSSWDEDIETYPRADPLGGTELWGYLPGSFLARIAEHIPEAATVHLDSTPVVTEVFVDLDGDGQRHWHTLLAATGTLIQESHSCAFALDITDPYQPQLLWEQQLPGAGSGRTRGVTVAPCDGDRIACLYLTADIDPGQGEPGIQALAIGLETGRLHWQFSAPYEISGAVAESTPAVPALMDMNGDSQNDTLVFGDMLGRLWALALQTGQPYGDGPVYSVPGPVAEPIGAGVAIHGNQAIFGTGGVAASSAEGPYAVYAVEITHTGGDLLWRFELQPGERIWTPPTLDAAGNLIFATAHDYPVLPITPSVSTGGRIVALQNNGQEAAQRDGGATHGRVVVNEGIVIAVSWTGMTTYFGTATRLTGPAEPTGSVKLLSWRQR